MHERARTAARWVLAAFLVFAGSAHFWNLADFQAQVPPWIPVDVDVVVWLSGVVEIVLGLALLLLPRHRALVGWLVAGLFVAVFPGNVAQYVEGRDAFGLDTDAARLTRLFFQPLLVAWALWCTGAWQALRARRSVAS
ncbi:membrane protein [Aeromicrobium halocynthiae]|uniref:Membrane protein n=1 Tax=Aeromicrobium halocynthiae TaxID=560557 RepID=A0ABN2VQ74_9ACTN